MSRKPYWNDTRSRVSSNSMANTALHEMGHHYYFQKMTPGQKKGLEEIQLQMLRKGLSKQPDTEEFFADIYRTKILKYGKIEEWEDKLTSEGVISIMDFLMGVFNE